MSFPGGARNVYERACDFFGDENMEERLYVAFAKFEKRQKRGSLSKPDCNCLIFFLTLQHERARAIYKYALDRIPKDSGQV